MSDIDDAFQQGYRGDKATPDATPDATTSVGRSGAAAATEPDAGFAPVLAKIAQDNPALAPHASNYVVQWGDPEVYAQKGYHLEHFPPWESENPNPGRPTLELYDRSMKGQALEDAIKGDMLHYLAAVNPEDGKPVDAKWRAMRDELIAARDANSRAMDERAYARDTKAGDDRKFDEWMDQSRADAHVRGYITPDKEDNWRNAYTPEQKQILEGMKAYLRSPGGGLINRATP